MFFIVLFQWTYTCGNSWGICPNGKGKVGCGPQETFRACADIAIGQDQANAVHQLLAKTPTQKTPVQVSHFLNQKFTAVPEKVYKNNLKSFTLPILKSNINQTEEQRKIVKYRVKPPVKDASKTVLSALDNLINSVEKCEAVGVYRGVPGMNKWCDTNCNHVPKNCPPTHCKCL